MTRRFAALADIHGNVWALEAVLDHARRRGVVQFVNLGDVLYGPLQLIVNPGSVGLPAYEDDLPVHHRMETGTPHSSYAILELTADGWDVEFHRVRYDWVESARCARSRGREDWARALLTGRANS